MTTCQSHSSKFNHPNIVKVLGVCVDNDPVYIIMELMPAGDLLKFLRDAKRDHVSFSLISDDKILYYMIIFCPIRDRLCLRYQSRSR